MNDIILVVVMIINIFILLWAMGYFTKRYIRDVRQCTRDCFSDMKNASNREVDQRIRKLNARRKKK